MIDLSPDSDGEMGSDALTPGQSSRSSGSSSPISFDASPSVKDISSLLSTKPHRSSDPAWAAILSRPVAYISPRDFCLVRCIGSGDIGTVYLCSLRDVCNHPSSMYAMKVVDKRALAKKNKLGRVDTERRILRVLDHPFLPTLFAEFDASPHFSCVVMEFCSGGDLHSLRHRQPGLRFSLPVARFYAAEVLLALEYLHMLGIVYRDLKPENVLIRSDGHIMLSDFDLSLESSAAPSVEISGVGCSDAEVITTSCFPDLFSRSKNVASRPSRQFIAEPVAARSNSFVGTHEYVAPEVAAGQVHGSAVDWWAYGIFLYELLYGRTPFAGPTNEATLHNILRQPLGFPQATGARDHGADSAAARGLISALLVKVPANRLGSRHGAAELKTHPFFKGMNFALMRCYRPPAVRDLDRAVSCRERPKPLSFDCF